MAQSGPALLWRPRSPLAVVILAAAVLLTLGAVALRIASFDLSYYGDDSLWLGVATASGAFALVRSFKLALLAAAVPFATVHVANAALVLIDRAAWGGGDLYSSASDVGFAISLAALAAGGIALWQVRTFADAASASAEPATAARSAFRAALGPGIAALLVLWLWRLFPLCFGGLVALRLGGVSGSAIAAAAATTGAASAALFGFLVLPAVLGRLVLDETTIARANRAAERVRNAAARLEVLAQPRWALSATGIALVLLALAFFDRARTLDGQVHYAIVALWRTQLSSSLGAPVCVVAVCLAWLRSWRLALAAGLAASIAATLYAWFSLRIGLSPSLDTPYTDYVRVRSWEMLAPGTAAIGGLVFLVAAGIASEDDVGAALQERAFTVLCIALTATVACLPTPAVLMPAAALIAALVLLPAFYVAIRALWPRYRSVDEVFGRT